MASANLKRAGLERLPRVKTIRRGEKCAGFRGE